ncbi:MAG: hypothetical protein U5L02_09140 [Rheinheimera sp.]|nr:hypothetical protein [Rheinheimera sp.]
MRAQKLLVLLFIVLPLPAAELLLMSLTPAADYQDEYNNYHPVKMVRQVLKYYAEPYAIESVSLNRAFAVLRKTPGACTPVVRKSAARLQEFLFSSAFIIAPDIRLLVKTDSPWVARLHRMKNRNGRVSLQSLMQLPHPPVLVTEDGRSYGDKLDPLLTLLREMQSVYVRTAKTSRYGDLLPMLEKDFVDATLEFTEALPVEEKVKFTAFRLAEAPDYTLAYFACAKDAQSAQVMLQLDQAIKAFRLSAEFRPMLLAPFPETERSQVWQAWLQLNWQEQQPAAAPQPHLL